MNDKSLDIRKYFVDEAGDGNLFSRKGHVIIGSPGCSRFFNLGILDIPNPSSLVVQFGELRNRILADPYFKDIPSLQLDARKTALAFHAKDDIPEVRREVFSVLSETPDLRFFAVVADKLRVLEYVRQRNARDSSYRYHPNELYDYLVRRLFRDRLHQDKGYEIYFAKRGKADRTAALNDALASARERFTDKWGITNTAPIHVFPSKSVLTPGLQAADYYLWALQRLFERGEERYVTYLWDSFSLVHDIDDRRTAGYGTYYSKRKPLTAAALEGRK